MSRRIERAVGLAEAFLRGGVANYVGTYWPVGDAAAEAFAQVFSTELLGAQDRRRRAPCRPREGPRFRPWRPNLESATPAGGRASVEPGDGESRSTGRRGDGHA